MYTHVDKWLLIHVMEEKILIYSSQALELFYNGKKSELFQLTNIK